VTGPQLRLDASPKTRFRLGRAVSHDRRTKRTGLSIRRLAVLAVRAVVAIGSSPCVPSEPAFADGSEHDDVSAARRRVSESCASRADRLRTAAKRVMTAAKRSARLVSAREPGVNAPLTPPGGDQPPPRIHTTDRKN